MVMCDDIFLCSLGVRNSHPKMNKWKHSLRVCLDGGFRREREERVYFSFLNYRQYEILFKKLTY